ncbi:MAG: hypothetical protein U1D55_10240 [Phycisphaerae bacterium]
MRGVIPAGAIACLLLTACQSSHPNPPPPSVPWPGDSKHGHDGRAILVDVRLRPEEWRYFRDIYQFRVDFEGSPTEFYGVLVGPNPQDYDAAASFSDPSNPHFALLRGWSYLSGHWPRVRTTRVISGVLGRGGLFVQPMQTNSNGVSVDRVFFVFADSGVRAFVQPLIGSGSIHYFSKPGMYVEVDGSGVVCNELDIASAPADVRRAYDAAIMQAKQAGLPTQ